MAAFAEGKTAAVRVCVVFCAIAATCSAVALLRLPLFELRINSLNSSITQSLFTTDIYTPLAEKHIPATQFTEKCEDLQMGFRIAQVCSVVVIICLKIAFICGVIHLTPHFTKTNFRVRCICGVPICLLLLLAVAAISMEGYVLRSMYEDDTNCSLGSIFFVNNDAMLRQDGVAVVPRPAILSEPRRTLSSVTSPHLLSIPPPLDLPHAPGEAVYARHAEPQAATIVHDTHCNPFDGCVASYRSMGFEEAAGYRCVWAVLGMAAFAALAEMVVMVMGASVVPQAGVMEETANLLHREDDERVI